ncbi:MAG: hypothetical protein J5769_07250 [Bacteroidales bacterium]|nr:hypothetical protein [Bacteroidales bacterium]
MRKLLLLFCLVSCTAQVQVDFIGPLQGENGGKSPHPYQGMDIYGNYMVSCQNQGVASVYELSGDTLRLEGQFHLASFHVDNHANVATFGLEKADDADPLPVIYVSQCSKNTIDGMKDVLYAERIAPDFSGSELLQTIFYDDTVNDFGYALQWVIDRENKMLYGYGNTVNNSDPDNRHRIIKFRLPKLSEGPLVVLKPEDALEDYLIEDVSGFRFNPIGQGLYIHKGKLYMPTGVGKAETPSIIYIWDLNKRSMKALDLSAVTTSEFEDISRYGEFFYIQAQDGVFRVKLGADAGKTGFDWHDVLPHPVYDADPEKVDEYYMAWDQAYTQLDTLPLRNFCKYCPSVFPRTDPQQDTLQAWAEYRHSLQTGSKGRLKKFCKLNGLEYPLQDLQPVADYDVEAISGLIESIIGIKEANAFEKTLMADFDRHPKGRIGVQGYRFGDIVCSVIATEKAIEVESNRPFTLKADGKSYDVAAGKNIFARN